MQTDLREAARHVCKEEEIKGAVGLKIILVRLVLYNVFIMKVYKR